MFWDAWNFWVFYGEQLRPIQFNSLSLTVQMLFFHHSVSPADLDFLFCNVNECDQQILLQIHHNKTSVHHSLIMPVICLQCNRPTKGPREFVYGRKEFRNKHAISCAVYLFFLILRIFVLTNQLLLLKIDLSSVTTEYVVK
eukprot:m.201036 g.201036  ORF g.201036 m.201036 type:complete len:141 (+) comp15741_c0_seq14:367-789(+)